MNKNNITLKIFLGKFKWKILFIIFAVFLGSYISFLIRFNLINNLAKNRQTKGYFYYLFGKYSLIEKVEKEKIFINWNRLLFVLFILYFPIKLIIKLFISYYQQVLKWECRKYLNDNVINKNHYSGSNNFVSKFSNQFVKTLVETSELIFDVFFILLNLRFIIEGFDLVGIIPSLIFLSLIYPILLGGFYYFIGWGSPTEDNDHQVNILYIIRKIPHLVTSGTSILFLFIYYQIQKEYFLSWGIYFAAYNFQLILLKIEKVAKLIHHIIRTKDNWKEIANISESLSYKI